MGDLGGFGEELVLVARKLQEGVFEGLLEDGELGGGEGGRGWGGGELKG